jgi:hypothetical protein
MTSSHITIAPNEKPATTDRKATIIDRRPSLTGETATVIVEDAVFGEVTGEGPNFRSVSIQIFFALVLHPSNKFQLSWIGTIALMTKTQIGLGVLSIPASFDTLGIVPGVLCLCAVGAITTWSSYMIGAFKRKHPDTYTVDDAAFKIFGKVGREITAAMFLLSE